MKLKGNESLGTKGFITVTQAFFKNVNKEVLCNLFTYHTVYQQHSGMYNYVYYKNYFKVIVFKSLISTLLCYVSYYIQRRFHIKFLLQLWYAYVLTSI